MKAKIKVGWPVGQDFKFFNWPEKWAGVIFDVEPMHKGSARYCCRSLGFGMHTGFHQDYGNGAVYADLRCLAVIDREGATFRLANEGRTLIFDAGA